MTVECRVSTFQVEAQKKVPEMSRHRLVDDWGENGLKRRRSSQK
jgi:hypothetical protein